MLIGIDASRANSKERTGTEWYSYHLIEQLKRIGGSHTFVLYSKEKLLPDLENLPDNFHSRVLAWPPRFLWTQFRLAWEMLFHPPEVLFVPAHTLPVISRAKMVVTIHDVGFRVYPELYSATDKSYHHCSVWYASRFAYKIICPSEFTKRELIKYYGTDASKIVVVPHGIEKPILSPSEGRAAEYLLYIGRLEQKKNVLGILQSFKQVLPQHPNLKLKLAGQPGYGFEQVQRYIEQNNLKNAVEILGYVDASRRAELYRNASAFIFPTLYEGFGMPILEAQSYGCPVITSNFGAAAEVSRESAVLVDPRNTHELAQAINKILADDHYRQKLIKLGYENIKKYSWESCAQETLKVLTT